jgi:hypothetical protein
MNLEQIAIEREQFIRPSSLRPISLCHGRPSMEAADYLERGELEDSTDAAMGTDLHGRAERVVQHWKRGMSWDEAHELVENEPGAEKLSSYDDWCLRFAVGKVSDLIDLHGIWRENVFTEHDIPMQALGMDRSGSADILLLIPHELLIGADYKFGYVDQGDPVDHDQTASYAAAGAELFNVRKVIFHIIQPRADKEHRFPAGAMYDAQALRDSAEWARSVVAAARVGNPKLTAGHEQCLHCRAITCKAKRNWIMDLFEALEFIGFPTDADEAGELVGAYKVAEKTWKEIKEEAKQRMKNGQLITGFKLGASSETRGISDDHAALEKLLFSGADPLELVKDGSLKLTLGKLSPAAQEVIADQVKEFPKSPSLLATKRK